MIPRVPLDTLDFTSFTMNLGSKMILDATRKASRAPRARSTAGLSRERLQTLKSVHPSIVDLHLSVDRMLAVKVSSDGRAVIGNSSVPSGCFRHADRGRVSDDVDLHDRENRHLGGLHAVRLRAGRPLPGATLIGISPVYGGAMGIDATWKQGYPEPLDDDRRGGTQGRRTLGSVLEMKTAARQSTNTPEARTREQHDALSRFLLI